MKRKDGQGAGVSGRAVEAGVSADEAVVGSAGAGEKYQRILDAAVEVIAERGYFNSPVSAIAARAGVADGTIYLYFKSKDDVLKAALESRLGHFHAVVAKKFETLRGAREQLEYIAWYHLQSATADRSMAVLMQTEMRQSAQFIQEFSQLHIVRYIQLVREVVRRGQEQGVFRRELSDGVVAHCFFGAIDELLSSTLFGSRPYDARETAEQVIEVLLHGISVGTTK